MANVKTEKQLDKELKDTFPASDPTSGNVFVGAPEERNCTDHECGCDKSEKEMPRKAS